MGAAYSDTAALMETFGSHPLAQTLHDALIAEAMVLEAAPTPTLAEHQTLALKSVTLAQRVLLYNTANVVKAVARAGDGPDWQPCEAAWRDTRAAAARLNPAMTALDANAAADALAKAVITNYHTMMMSGSNGSPGRLVYYLMSALNFEGAQVALRILQKSSHSSGLTADEIALLNFIVSNFLLAGGPDSDTGYHPEPMGALPEVLDAAAVILRLSVFAEKANAASSGKSPQALRDEAEATLRVGQDVSQASSLMTRMQDFTIPGGKTTTFESVKALVMGNPNDAKTPCILRNMKFDFLTDAKTAPAAAGS